MSNELAQNPDVTCVFDWYQATTRVGIHEFQDTLSDVYDFADWRTTKATNNYHHGAQLVSGDRVVLTALWGGPNGTNVHAFSTGYEARKFSSVLRERLPNHSVTRADGALDFIEPDAWDNIERMALHVADKYKIKVQHLGDFHNKLDGRTLNLGGVSADVRSTIYEKGKQLGEDPNWVRVEVKVKPPRLTKEQFNKGQEEPRIIASRLQPVELFGCTRWTNSLLENTTGIVAPSLPLRSWGKTDQQKAYASMLAQYKNVFANLLENHGSPSAVGAQIYQDLKALKK